MQKLFFKLEDHVWGPAIHVAIIIMCLAVGLIGVFWWVHAPLLGIACHTAYCMVYKRYKRRWDKRENIIDSLLGDLSGNSNEFEQM